MSIIERYNKITEEIDTEVKKILKENKQVEISARTGICTAYLNEMIKGKKIFKTLQKKRLTLYLFKSMVN